MPDWVFALLRVGELQLLHCFRVKWKASAIWRAWTIYHHVTPIEYFGREVKLNLGQFGIFVSYVKYLLRSDGVENNHSESYSEFQSRKLVTNDWLQKLNYSTPEEMETRLEWLTRYFMSMISMLFAVQDLEYQAAHLQKILVAVSLDQP